MNPLEPIIIQNLLEIHFTSVAILPLIKVIAKHLELWNEAPAIAINSFNVISVALNVRAVMRIQVSLKVGSVAHVLSWCLGTSIERMHFPTQRLDFAQGEIGCAAFRFGSCTLFGWRKWQSAFLGQLRHQQYVGR